MKSHTIIILLMLIATSTFAQPFKTMRTDRLLAASGLSDQRTVRFIESFQYEGNKEAKRWRTGYYAPKKPRTYRSTKISDKQIQKNKRTEEKLMRKINKAKHWRASYDPQKLHQSSAQKKAERKQQQYKRKMEKYDKKLDAMLEKLPRNWHLFIAKPAFYPPYGFTYSYKDTALVYLAHQWNGDKKRKKVTFLSYKMKVDEAVYDSIQCLHKLAVYTSACFDPQSTVLDGTSLHFIWRSGKDDKYAISPDNGFYDSKPLGRTFESICKAIKTDDHELLLSLMPTVHELLAHYRTLLLPDVPIDDWDLDATVRHIKKEY